MGHSTNGEGMGKGIPYLLNHGGCQPVDHTHPNFIRLHTGPIRNTMGLHPIHSPHGSPCKGLDIELKDGSESTDHMQGRKYLERAEKRHRESLRLASHLQGKPSSWLFSSLTSVSPSPRPQALRNHCPAHWSDMILRD